MEKNKQKPDTLQLIPKAQSYIEYVIEIIIKLPRTEKFNIGNEYKNSVYQMLEYILWVNKIEGKDRLQYFHKIDCLLNIQRIFARIMYKYHWIDTKEFTVIMDKIGEIGKMLGGLIKYYGKNYTK